MGESIRSLRPFRAADTRMTSANLAYSFMNNMVWPLYSKDPENKPKLVGIGKRIFFASTACTLSSFVVSGSVVHRLLHGS